MNQEKLKKMNQDIENFFKLGMERTKNIESSDFVTTFLVVREAGGGKSHCEYLIDKSFAKGNQLFFQCNNDTQIDDLFFGVLIKAIEESQKRKVVLILDKLDKAPRDVDAFLLEYFQNFRVEHPQHGMVQGIKSNIIVLITSNGERRFIDALYRRVIDAFFAC